MVLASGTAAGQAIVILGSLILLRLYSPDQVGAFGVYLAVVSIGAIAVTLRYDAALPLPESEAEALDVLALAVVATTVLSVIAGLAAWVIVGAVAAEAVASETRSVLWLLPVGLLLAGLQQVLTMWATRLAAFGASARSSVAASSAQTAGQIALGVPSTGVPGLVVGYVIGRSAAILVLLRTVDRSRRESLRHTTPRRLGAVAARYRRFPLYALWAALLNTVSVQSPVLLLAAMFETAVVGWFSITVRVLQLPSTLVGNAVGQVFYARVSREDRSDAATTTSTVYRALVSLGTGPMVLLAIGGEQLFALAFGEVWSEAGRYAQWLAPWLLLVFVTSPLSTLVFVKERQRAELVFQAALLAARTATLLTGWTLASPSLAIALFGAGSALMWGGYMLWLLRIGGAGVRGPVRWFARDLAVALVLGAPLFIVTVAGVHDVVWVVVAGGCLAAVLLRAQREIRTLRLPA